MKKGEGKTEHKSRSQVLVHSSGRFMLNNEDWILKTGKCCHKLDLKIGYEDGSFGERLGNLWIFDMVDSFG